MGLKKMFKKKEPTAEEIREHMQDSGLVVKTSSTSSYNRNKFDAYKDYAAQVTQKSSSLPPARPSNPYAVQNNSAGGNPYAAAPTGGNNQNPYGSGGGSGSSRYGNSPYGGNTNQASEKSRSSRFGRSKNDDVPPPASQEPRLQPRQYAPSSSAYSRDGEPQIPPPPMPNFSNPYASANQGYGSRFGAVDRELEQDKNALFGNRNNNTNTYDPSLEQSKYAESTMSMPRQQLTQQVKKPQAAQYSESAVAVDEEEDLLLGGGSTLNLGRVDSYNYGNKQDYGKQNYYSYNNQGHEFDAALDEDKTEQDQEDEDVEAVKQQIRFTKQQSAASTRNALRYAADAEESGRNTLGMLGSQGERLYNIHGTLALATTQHTIAENKAKELKTVTRSMFRPHVSNPFNSKRRAQEKEDKIRRDRAVAQVEREQRRRDAYDSQQRVAGALDGEKSQLRKEMMNKYGNHAGRERYQFEADEEDDILEDEIDNNLDELSHAAGRLKKLGLAMNEEVETQNAKLDQIAEQTDNLDISVHLNTARLAGIK